MHRHPRGSAMVETVLALPVILVMLVLVIGFGLATRRFSPQENAVRFRTWHHPTPSAPGPSDAALAAAFYPKDRPASLTCTGGDTALPAQVDQPLTSVLSDDPRLLADEVLRRFPRLVHTDVVRQHDSSLPPLRWIGITAPTLRFGARLNGDWRYEDDINYLGQPWAAYPDGWHPRGGGPRVSAAATTAFLSGLDGALPAGGRVKQGIQSLYAGNPGYVGPNWTLNPNVFPPGMDSDGP